MITHNLSLLVVVVVLRPQLSFLLQMMTTQGEVTESRVV